MTKKINREIELLADICCLVEMNFSFTRKTHPQLSQRLSEAEELCAEKFGVNLFEEIDRFKDLSE